MFISQTTDFHFANYRFSFRKLQISISQTTDFHFAKYRFPFRKLQIPISQTTDFHFHFVSSHFVSQTTVSQFRQRVPRITTNRLAYCSSIPESAEEIKRWKNHENNIQRVSESQLRDALDTVWIIMIRCIILI